MNPNQRHQSLQEIRGSEVEDLQFPSTLARDPIPTNRSSLWVPQVRANALTWVSKPGEAVPMFYTPPLKLHPNRQLQLPSLSSCRLASNILRSLIDIHRGSIPIRVPRIDMVERVISVQPELRKQALMNREILLYRHIRIEEIRTEFSVTSSGPNLIQSRSREIPLRPIRVKVVEAVEE